MKTDKLTTQLAIEFFEEELSQYDAMLKGILSDRYRKYLEEKVVYYQKAIEALENMKVGD